MISQSMLGLIFAIVFTAAVLRGFGGFGFALLSVPLLASTIAPRDAVVLSILLQFAVGFIELRQSIRLACWQTLRPLLLGAMLATPVGYLCLAMMSAQIARLIIAVAASLAVALIFIRRAQHLEKRLSPLIIGTAAGLMNGLAAMPGPPILVYFLEGNIPSNVSRASMIVFFFATSLLAAASIFIIGGFSVRILELSVFSLPALIIGSWLGKMMFGRVSPLVFKRVVLAALLAAATTAICKALV